MSKAGLYLPFSLSAMGKYIIIACALLAVYGLVRISYNLAAVGEFTNEEKSHLSSLSTTTAKLKTVQSAEEQKNLSEALNRRVAGDVLPDSNLYQLKMFGEWLRSYLAKTEDERVKLRVEHLNRRLAEAEVLLETGKTGLAQIAVNKFAQGSLDLMSELRKQDLLRNNPAKATEIEEAVKNQIALQKSLMTNISSTSPLYAIKRRIAELELEMADTPEGKAAIQQKQAKESQAVVNGKTAVSGYNPKSDWQILKEQAMAVTANQRAQLAGLYVGAARLIRQGWQKLSGSATQLIK